MGQTDLAILAQSLPASGKIQQINPLIRARIHLSGSRRSWYLVSADQRNKDVVFFGTESECLYDAHARTWRHFTLAFFERLSAATGSEIAVDATFTPCRFSDLDLKDGEGT
jgi:hypothetical protein